MKWFKKIGTFFLYAGLLLLIIYIISPNALSNLFSSEKSDGKGILVGLVTYLKDADTWNLIFVVIIFGVGIALFFITSMFAEWVFKKTGDKYPRVSFLKHNFFSIITAFASLFALFLIASNLIIPIKGNGARVGSIDDIQKPAPAFLLGTSKFLSSSTPDNPKINLYYKYRIDAAIDLWKANKVDFFILSGDGVGEGHKEDYDEIREMKSDLVAAGIPLDKIKVDPFGFNTQNSILRLRGVFKLNEIILISQNFQNVRASTMSQYYGITSMAYDAKGSMTSNMFFKEVLQSRPKLVMDLLVFNMQPRVTEDGDFQYREDFDVTKSDKHVWTIIILVAIIMFGLIGIGLYRGKKGTERKKFAIQLSAGTLVLSTVLIILVIQIYKNVDIKFIDEVVETISKAVGVQTEKMEKKKEEVLLKLEEGRKEKEILTQTKIDSTSIEPDLKSEVKSEFNTAVADNRPAAEEVIQVKTEEPKTVKEEDPFNTSGSDSFSSDASDEIEKPVTKKKFFKAKVHNTKTVVNDGSISLRLAEPIVLNGQQYPADYVFDAKTALFGGRIIIVPTNLGDGIKNFENGSEGGKIEARHRGKKGEIILAEGEPVTFGYY